MRVSFHSQSDDDKIYFQAEANKVNNELTFVDKSTPNTSIKLAIFDDHLVFQRTGDTNMEFGVYLDAFSPGKYQNNLGLEFDFEVKCTSLEIQEKRICFEYELYLDKEYRSSHKIWILFH